MALEAERPTPPIGSFVLECGRCPSDRTKRTALANGHVNAAKRGVTFGTTPAQACHVALRCGRMMNYINVIDTADPSPPAGPTIRVPGKRRQMNVDVALCLRRFHGVVRSDEFSQELLVHVGSETDLERQRTSLLRNSTQRNCRPMIRAGILHCEACDDYPATKFGSPSIIGFQGHPCHHTFKPRTKDADT